MDGSGSCEERLRAPPASQNSAAECQKIIVSAGRALQVFRAEISKTPRYLGRTTVARLWHGCGFCSFSRGTRMSTKVWRSMLFSGLPDHATRGLRLVERLRCTAVSEPIPSAATRNAVERACRQQGPGCPAAGREPAPEKRTQALHVAVFVTLTVTITVSVTALAQDVRTSSLCLLSAVLQREQRNLRSRKEARLSSSQPGGAARAAHTERPLRIDLPGIRALMLSARSS